jgi:hypothetical protein
MVESCQGLTRDQVGAYLKLFEKHNPSPPKKKKSKIV